MYIFAVQDDRISGVVCTRCFDRNNLAFVSDGRVQGDTLSFTLLHDRGDGKPYQETFRGKVAGGRITLTASREGNPQTVTGGDVEPANAERSRNPRGRSPTRRTRAVHAGG